MAASFRNYIEALKEQGELAVVTKPVDLRNVAALAAQSEKALLFTNVSGYAMPVATALLQSRNRIAIGMECAYEKIESKLRDAMDHPVEPVHVGRAPVKEIVVTDSLPIAPNGLTNLRVVSVAPLLGEAIRRIHRNESVSYLFD